MRGSAYKWIYFSFALILAASLFALLAIFFFRGAIETTVTEQTVKSRLNVGAAAYMIEDCLSEGGVMLSTKLEEEDGKTVCEICKVCETEKFVAKVTDMQSGVLKSWDFGYKVNVGEKVDEKKATKISVNIKYETGVVHFGRLDVVMI